MNTSTHLQVPEYWLPEDIVRFSGARLSMGFSHHTVSRSNSSSGGGYRERQLASRATSLSRSPSASTQFSDDPLSADILSWTALINAQTYSPCIQSIPTDVSRPEVDGEDATSPLSAFFDPTTLDIGFDYTCLDGLDDTLLYSPLDAFAEACWDDAVRTSTLPDRSSTPTPSSVETPIKFRTKVVRESRTRSPLSINFNSSDESDESDSDECRTCHEDDEASLSYRASPLDKTKHHHHHHHHHPAVDEGRSMFFDDHTDQLALLGLELDASARARHFHVPDPNQSVGYFPIPVKQKKPALGTGKIAAFWGSFPKPTRLVLVKSSP